MWIYYQKNTDWFCATAVILERPPMLLWESLKKTKEEKKYINRKKEDYDVEKKIFLGLYPYYSNFPLKVKPLTIRWLQ